MKKILLSLTLLLGMLLFTPRAQASHVMGVDITYTCVNNCTITVTVSGYRDCSGITFGSTPPAFMNTPAGCATPLQIGGWSSPVITEVTPLCPGSSTQCTNPSASINGVQEYVWTTQYNFCSANCSNYFMSFSTCCRNGAITSLTGASGQGTYTGSTVINPTITPCNNSPQFVNPPVPYICENQSYTFNQGAVDPDGDSLVYSLGPCYSGAGTQVTYAAGYSPTAPLGPDWIVVIDSITGDIAITPNPASPTPGSAQVGVLCVYVEEYRNGVLIGTIVRDVQITTIPCPNNTLPSTVGVTNPVNSNVSPNSNFIVYTCSGAAICFDIPVADPDANQQQTIFWDQNLASAGATFTQTGNPAVQNSITGINPSATFCWTPSGPGQYQFLVTMVDNACPIIGQNQYTFRIIVSEMEFSYSFSNLCYDAEFCATPTLGLDPFTFSWAGQGGLSSPDSCTAHTYPGPGDYEIALTVTDSVGCQVTQLDTITIPPGAIADAGPDQTICSGDTITIGAPPSSDHIYSWTPSADLTDPAASQTTAIVYNNLPTSTTRDYIITAINTLTGCVESDTMTLTINPLPSAAFTASTGPQCFDNNSFTFNYVGGAVGATYSWTFQDGTPAIASVSNPTVSFNTPGDKEVSLTVSANGCSATYIDTIRVFEPPVADAGPDMSFCEGEGGATLQPNITGGTAPYYYTWWCQQAPCGIDSLNDDDPLVNPNSNMWYYLQVTDFNGCTSNIDSVFVTILPKPIVDAGPDIVICGDSAPGANLAPNVTGGNGPYAYQWIPSAGLSDPTIPNPYARPDTTTIYTLVVTDLSTGCTSDYNTLDTVSTVIVYVNPIPVAESGPDRDICLGDSIMLQGYATNAGPVYNYQWTPANSLSDSTIANPMAFPTATTEYVLVAWSNGCPSYGDTIKVTVHELPTVNAGPDRDVCVGEPILIDATTDSATTFTWYPTDPIIGSTTTEDILVSLDTTTTFTVTGTSDWGCESIMDTVTIWVKPLPVADAGMPQTICAGDSVTLNGGYSYNPTGLPLDPSQIYYSWSPASEMDDSTLAQPTVWPTSSGWYYLTINYSTCSTYDSVFVSVIPEMNAWADADTVTSCSGDSIQLYAGGGLGGASFTWFPTGGLSNPNTANPMAAPDESVTYFVVVKEGGCTDTAEVSLDILPTPEAAYLSSLTRGCAEFTVNFLQAATDAQYYIWDFGDGTNSNESNPSHTYTEPGTYTVTMTAVGMGGCESTVSDITVFVAEEAKPDFTSDPLYPANLALPDAAVTFTNLSELSTTYVWDFGDGTRSDEINPTHIYQQPGTYMVTLTTTNSEGCESSVTHGPYVVMQPDLMIPNVFTPNGDNQNDEFVVYYTGSQPFEVSIYDRWGKLQFQSRNRVNGWDGTVNSGSTAPEGVYFYNVTIGDKTYTGEVTLMR